MTGGHPSFPDRPARVRPVFWPQVNSRIALVMSEGDAAADRTVQLDGLTGPGLSPCWQGPRVDPLQRAL